ncbi:RCC1 domain-containing protein [Flavobacterium sp. 3HN19-14]|uniref:RCC1 domain-containing protein n=1 Tax=Flavobacterium sp. 3HN19-14 TaxID=3448133 RepID=UPI003EE03A50
MKSRFNYIKQILILFLILASSALKAQCWKEFSTGMYHTLAIKEDGTLWAWGFNQFGQLGDGTENNSVVPVQVGTSNDWKMVNAGGAFSMAIKNNGTLWGWGYNYSGQLGLGTSGEGSLYYTTPQQVGTLNTWKTVSADSGGSTLALKNDGTLWGWGTTIGIMPSYGADTVATPTQIGTDNDWKQVDHFGSVSFGIKTNGTLWGWGTSFGNGELGAGMINYYAVPTQIGTSSDWKQISSGHRYNMAIRNDGSLWLPGARILKGN